MRSALRAIALCLVALPMSAADPAPAGGEFAAMATVKTNQGTRSMGLDVVVTSFMSVEQAQSLKRVLEEGGQRALLNMIRGTGQGRIRLGAFEYPIDLVVAERTKDGERYSVVTSRPMRYEEAQEGWPSVDYPFTIIVFEVPEFGKGEGRIFTKAALFVDSEGHVRAEQYEHEPGTLKDVKRLK